MKKFLIISLVYLFILFSVGILSLYKGNQTYKNEITKKNILINKYSLTTTTTKTVTTTKKSYTNGTITANDLNNIDLNGYDNLMIVTHPDDESFWAGGHLIEQNYFVICVTCGIDLDRELEFKNMMKETNDKYITLGYTKSVDISSYETFNWFAASKLTQDIEKIIELKDWNLIVTHNPNGEYGHKNHILVSQVVTSLVSNKEKLYYFGKYYSKKNISFLDKDALNNNLYETKDNIIKKHYKKRMGSILKHHHMFKNENFISYSKWYTLSD